MPADPSADRLGNNLLGGSLADGFRNTYWEGFGDEATAPPALAVLFTLFLSQLAAAARFKINPAVVSSADRMLGMNDLKQIGLGLAVTYFFPGLLDRPSAIRQTMAARWSFAIVPRGMVSMCTLFH
jgi:hypothetical protein